MNYHQITVHTVTEAVEAISYAFMELGAGGVEIFDPKDILEHAKKLIDSTGCIGTTGAYTDSRGFVGFIDFPINVF